MSESPLDRLLGAVDKLDVEATVALIAPDGCLLTPDGSRVQGSEAIRGLISDFMATLRSTKHHVTSQWHQDNVWIAEVEATYELQDWLQITALPRVFVLRGGPDGIADLRVYGAHERPLTDHRTGEEGMWVRDHWIPPL